MTRVINLEVKSCKDCPYGGKDAILCKNPETYLKVIYNHDKKYQDYCPLPVLSQNAKTGTNKTAGNTKRSNSKSIEQSPNPTDDERGATKLTGGNKQRTRRTKTKKPAEQNS